MIVTVSGNPGNDVAVGLRRLLRPSGRGERRLLSSVGNSATYQSGRELRRLVSLAFVIQDCRYCAAHSTVVRLYSKLSKT
jgi:hypothetical protein